MKSLKTLFFLAAFALLALTLFGCGQEPGAEAPEQADADQAAPAAEAEPLQVGFVYVSPIGDAGYSFAHHQGALAVGQMPGVEISYVENVPEGADAERVIMNMARKGYDMIFATSFGYMDPMLNVAGQFPDQAFLHCSGFKSAPNMSNYFGRIYQARYLTGMVAGAMTRTNQIGYVAAFPIPEVIRGINAFTLGAQRMNPDVEVRVVWTKTWYDPALEKDAAVSLLDVGCDVIAQHQDSPGPQEAAQEAGAYSVGYNSNMQAFAPAAHLTAAIWNWAPLYTEMVRRVQEGTWQGGESIWWGMEHGVVDIAPLGAMVPANVAAEVDAEKAQLVAGNDNVFQGPIADQSGAIRIPEGQRATDEELLGMTWFVQGVIGTTE